MKPRALLMIVLGLLIGPGYYAFCEHISGRPGQSYALTERGDRWTLPDGSILRVRSGLAYKPVPLELTPDSNGYRLRLSFNVTQSDSAADATNKYQVSLMQGDIGVEKPRMWVAGIGLVLLVFGIGMQLREVFVQARKR